MGPILRSVGAVLAAAVAAVAIIFAAQTVSLRVYPLPPGVDPYDPEQIKTVIPTLPAGAFLFVLAGYALGAFAGAWLAARLAGRAALTHGLTLGGVLLLMGVVNVVTIPHPLWFVVVCLAVFPAAALCGALLARRAGPPPTDASGRSNAA